MSFGLVNVEDGSWKKVRRNFSRISSVLFGPSATPTFSSLTLTGLTLSSLTASRLVSTDANKALASVTNLTAWIAGTANRVTVSDDADGTVTLTGPQDIHTSASPTFADLTLSTPSSIYALSHDSFADFVAGEHFLQTAITNVSTGLATGVLKVTTGTGALSSVAGISGSLVLDDGVTERITLVFTDGILTSRTVEATVGSLIDWTD